MRVAAMPMRMRIRMVIVGLLLNNPGLVRTLLVALVGDTVVRVHVGDEGR
jgi:hypothetical protein